MYEGKLTEHVIPLRLFCEAFAVYQQLREEEKADDEHIKPALLKVFATDGFVVYEEAHSISW